jgi:hypothetical protein
METRPGVPMTADDLPLLVLWERTLGDLLDRTQKFPRSVRFTFSNRIDNLALDVMERLVEARYASGRRKTALLREADSAMTRLRILLRLCRDRRYLDRGGFEHVVRNLDEAGRMLGGWLQGQESR